MNSIYTAESLNGKLISDLKAIARTIGATVEGDLRKKATWVEAIINCQLAITPVTVGLSEENEKEDWQEDVQAIIELDASSLKRDFIAEEDEIIDQINILSDALNFAIVSESYNPECPSIRQLEEQVDALNFQLQEVANAHRKYIQLLCADEPVVDIWWQSDNNGAVSIDGGQTYRCFRVLDMLSDRPVIKLTVNKKQEIDSRYVTTKNNRYMRAVTEAIPAHIKQLASEIWEDGEIIGYSDEEPPNRGDNGRGRVEAYDEF